MATTCIFRPGDLHEGDPAEHILPQSMGGRMVSHSVGRLCNHWLGQHVDTVADENPFPALRLEAGLETHPYEVTYRRPGVELDLRARVNGAGEIIDSQDVYKDDKQVVIIRETQEQVQRIAAKMVARAELRGEAPPRLGAALERVAGAMAITEATGAADIMKHKLTRFCAKVAIEFIDRVSDEALDPALDPIREFAMGEQGAGDALEFDVVAIGGGLYWLPKTQRVLYLAAEPHSTDLKTELQPGQRPMGSRQVDRLVHRLALDATKHSFQLTLFSIVRVSIQLPPSVRLPDISEACILAELPNP